MTVAQARRALADAFRQAELDSPELDARLLVGHALGLDHTALDDRQRPRASARTARTRWLRLPRGGSAASRSRAFSASRNSGACRCGSTKPRWCRGRRPKPSSRRRWPRSTATVLAPARCALPISAPARARSWSRCLTRVAERDRHRHRRQPRGARGCARQRRPPRLCLARGIRRLRFRRGARAAPSIWSVSNPPYIASAEIARCPPRCGTIPAARSTAAPTDLAAIAPLRDRAPSCSSPTAIWWSSLASARNRQLRHCSVPPALYPRPRIPIFRASRGPCMRMLPQ